jgi:hypothetical protein
MYKKEDEIDLSIIKNNQERLSHVTKLVFSRIIKSEVTIID